MLKDEIICLKNESSKSKYPSKLRRVSIWDEENKHLIEFITNQFTWTPNTIVELCKSRWQEEIFFREIKTIAAYQIIHRNK